MTKGQKSCRSVVWAFILVLVLGSGVGCNPPGGSGGSEPPRTGDIGRFNPDLLTKGDRVVITYAGIPNPPLPHSEQIRQDGTISPPFLDGPVKAAGLTTGELRAQLMSRYVPSLYSRLSLTVKAEERYFTVDGEVNAPGLYPYIGTMTVLDGIASARGLNDFANKKKIRITRSEGGSVNFNYNRAIENRDYDRPLYPGDIINVPRRLY